MKVFNTNSRLFIVFFLIISFSFMFVTPALADEQPPPTDIPEEVTVVDEISDQTEVMEEAQEVQEDEVQVDEYQPDESASNSTGEVDTVSEALDSAPTETEIIVVNESGEVLPLASQEASEVIAFADPIWCPASVATPVSGGSGCSPSFTSMTGLITWLNGNNPNQAGTIWIEGGYDSSTAVGDGATDDFTLNGTTLTNMSNFALIIKGGWNGIGTNTINTANPSRFEGDSLSIINWTGNITINDIEIFNADSNPNGPSALRVETDGSITLNRVDANFNDGILDGAYLNNSAPAKSASITINESSFFGNAWTGAFITSNGSVTIKDSIFTFNAASDGAIIDNDNDVTPSPVTITNSSAIANGNGLADNGFQVNSNGVVTLTDVVASSNQGSGVVINTTANSVGSANVVLNNSNTFESNVEYGLQVLTNSTITIKHIMANANGLDNANLDNNNTDLNLLIKPITISGTGIFNGSTGGSGLVIVSNGVVTLSNITAGNNFMFGASIDTDTAIVNNSAVTLKGTNTFNNNGLDGFRHGLQIVSDGNISISNVTANSNGERGVNLDNNAPPAGKAPSVTVVGFLTALNNDTRGLNIDSDGAVTLTNLTITGNQLYGATINNSGAPSPQPIKITGTNTFNNNYGHGLEIDSRGAVTLNSITASGNGFGVDEDGVNIDNTQVSSIQQNVIITGSNSFNDNGRHGLFIESYGVVTISNITANNNGDFVVDASGDGVLITNAGGDAGNKIVTLTGYGIFNGNDANGLSVISDGTVTTNNLTALGNDLIGIYIVNPTDAVSPITLNGINFLNGNVVGAQLVSDGAVKISKATANDNSSLGLQLINTTSQPVTLLGFVTANNNGVLGIQVVSQGVITVANSTAIGNGNIGMQLNNPGAATPKAVTLTGNNYFESNMGIGLHIVSAGAITISNVTALENGLSGVDGFAGVYLQNNNNPTSQQPVTLNGYNVFNGNGYHGLQIASYGVVTLNNLTALDNGHFINDSDGHGVFIDNFTGATAVKAVVLKGTNIFNGNEDNGLNILSLGAITLSNITAYSNEGTGINLTNTASPVNSVITITGYANSNNNGGGGILIDSNGLFTGTNISANQNSIVGLFASIDGVTSIQGLTLKGNNTFNGNTGSGLYVATDGNITISNINANNNSFSGAQLDSALGSITLTGFGTFNNNSSGSGLVVLANTNVTLTRVTANYNGTGVGDDGIHVDANGNVTLTCVMAIDNFEDGLQAIVGGNLTIKGLFASLNGDNEDYLVTGTTTITTCP